MRRKKLPAVDPIFDIEWWKEETHRWEAKHNLLEKRILLLEREQKVCEMKETMERLQWIMKMNTHANAVRRYFGGNFDTDKLSSLILEELKRLRGQV